MGVSWTQPICDECYDRLYPGREPHRIRYDLRDVEQCCQCGDTVRSGIYVRIDPKTVLFPQGENN